MRVIVSVVALAACGAESAQFHVTQPDDPTRARTISILGVYHDGRMAPDEWADLGAGLVGQLGETSCGVLFSPALPTEHPDLAAAIDKHARAAGVTDALLGALAPATGADAILLVEVSGHPPRVLRTETTLRPPRMGMTKPASPYQTRVITDGNALDIAVSAFSVAEHKIIARLAMHYTGRNAQQALHDFAARFAQESASWRCTAWRAGPPLDASAIEQVAD